MKYFSVIFLFILLGCSKEYTILESVDGLFLSANETTRIINQTTKLKLVKNNGDDVTLQSVFFVNGVKLDGNEFTKAEIGTYIITANYNQFPADNNIEIIYHNGSLTSFKSNVLLEDYTGVWCGNCPRVVHALELADNQLGVNKDQLIKVAIHRSSTNPQDASYDPFTFDASAFEPNGGYPKAFINRSTRWTPLEYNNLGMISSETQSLKQLGLKMSSELLANNNIKLSVTGLFAAEFSNLGLIVYVLESGFIQNQINYTSFFGGTDPIINFKQDHILKSILTAHNGDLIPDSRLGSEFTRQFIVPSASFQNPTKVEFVAFFINSSGRVLNARLCKVNEGQTFQLN